MEIVCKDSDKSIESLVNQIEVHPVAWRAIHCLWDGATQADIKTMASRLDAVGQLEESYLFKWGNEDIFILCKGARREKLDALKQEAEKVYAEASNSGVNCRARVFDMSVEWSSFNVFFKERQKVISKQVEKREDVELGDNIRLVFDYEKQLQENFGELRIRRRGTSILLVNGDQFAARMMSSLLKGYIVNRAYESQNALDQYFEVAPDMVFIDVDMPRFDGWEILDVIKKFDSKAFVIMLTDNSSEEEVRKAVARGVQGYIKKPVTQKKLDAYIGKFWKTAPPHKQITTV